MNERVLSENQKGFIDQYLASIRIHKWLEIHGENKLSFPATAPKQFHRGVFLKEGSTRDENLQNWMNMDEIHLPKGFSFILYF